MNATVRCPDGGESEYPVLSTRKNGDRLLGYTGPFGEDLYAAGTPPVWGLSTKDTPGNFVGLPVSFR